MTGKARVALLTTFYHPLHGGSEMAARRLAAVLARRGHDIVVVTKRTDPALADHDVVDDVRVERIGPSGARRGSGKWTVVPWAFAALVRRRAEYDVICVIDYRGIGLAAILAGVILRRPVIIQAQTEGVLSCSNWAPALKRLRLAPEHPVVRAISWPLRRAYGAADAMACISRRIEAEAIAEGIPRERVHYLPNTVDTARFRPALPGERARLRAELGWPIDRVTGIFVGRLSREKGIVELLQAWRHVAPPAALVVVGPDMPGHAWDEGPRVRALAADPALAGRVRILGASGDTAPLYRAADFAIVPSHWESFGISAAEAMSSGLPVVASAVGGLLDYVVDGGNGRLVAPRDPAALAAAIDSVAGDESLRRRLGAAARDAMRPFDERLVLEQFGTLVDQLDAARAAGAHPAGLLGLSRNILYAGASAGSAMLLLGVLMLAGRILGDEAFGRFSFALALATIGEALMDFGLHQVTVRSVARDRAAAPGLFRNSLALKLGPAIVMVAAIVLLSRWLRPDADVRTACLLLAASAVMRSYLLTIRGVLQGLELFGRDSAIVLLDRVLLLGMSTAVLLSGGTLVALAWAFVGARVLALVAALAIARRQTGALSPAFDLATWRDLQRRALPLGAFLIVLNLYAYIDTVMLGVLSSDVDTGLYNAAYRLYEGLTYAPAVLSSVLTPRLATEFLESRLRHTALARQGLLASVVLAALLALVTWAAGGWALSLLFGHEFAPATRALRILAVGLVFVFPIWILHAVAISMTAERVLLQTTAVGVLVNVGANLVLIPAAGRDGAALATVIGEAVSLALLLRGLRTALVSRAG